MTNFKKVGLTALAASLVSVSAHAGSLSASGSASMNTEGFSGEQLDAGTTFSMANSVKLSGSGELDNGMTVSVSFELDDSSANGTKSPFDNHSVTVSSDSLGTLVLAGHGGSSSVGAIDTTAAGDMWDNFDGVTYTGGVTVADAVSANSGENNNFLYTSPDLMDGLNVTLSYNPQTTDEESETGFGVNYSGIEGLSLSYAVTDENTHAGSDTSGDNTVIKASYAYGPVTVAYSEMEHDEGLSSGANDITMTSYALTYTMSDELSVTYGSETSDKGSKTTDLEVEGISVAYTTGGMTISASTMSLENGNWGTGSEEDMDYWALGASFAF